MSPDSILRPVPKPKRKKMAPTGRPWMKRINKKRGGHMFPKNVDEERREYIRGLPCVLSGRWYRPTARAIQRTHVCIGAVRACHLKSRGSGGKDAGNMWPGCDGAHEQQHHLGVPAFEAKWNINLAHECARHEGFWLWLARVDRGGQT